MPLIYKAYQSSLKTKTGEKLFYPRLVKYPKVVDTQRIGEMMSRKASLTPGDVHNVIRNLMEVMREQLLNSRTVRLDGLGTFTMIAKANGKGVPTEKEVSPNQINTLNCRFTPEYKRPDGTTTTRALTMGVEYVHINELAQNLLSEGESGGEGEGEDPSV